MSADQDRLWDIVIVGAGTAGIPCAIWAQQRGARVLLLEAGDKPGGTMHISSGQLSAAGTKLQKALGIEDTPEAHFDDIIRISRNTVDRDLVRMAVWNAADTLDWLTDLGFRPLDGHPVDGQAHEPYSERRYYWGEHGGLDILNTLLPPFQAALDSGHVTLLTQHRVTELIQDDSGAVRGVVAEDANGARHSFHGRSVLLSCGGYAANPELFEQLSGRPQLVDHSYPQSQGWGIKLGLSAGGHTRGAEKYLSGFGYILEGDDYPAKILARAILHPQRRQPWELWVNDYGKRFVREDIDSVDAREHALLDQPGLRWWMVFDRGILETAQPVVDGWSWQEIDAATASQAAFFKADSLEDLAAATGVDADGLARTVAAYNYGIDTGKDFFGRQHCPVKIGTGPFYAIRMQGGSVSSTVGLAVDPELRVIRKDGAPIPGLYAAGELLGSGQLMGNAFCGGMMVTPALTFGRLLGQRMLPVGNEKAEAA